jgi:hypothetical protein
VNDLKNDKFMVMFRHNTVQKSLPLRSSVPERLLTLEKYQIKDDSNMFDRIKNFTVVDKPMTANLVK